MPKKYHTRRNLKGGFDSVKQTFTDLGTSITRVASNAWTSTKKALGLDNTSNYTPSSTTTSTPSVQSSYTQSTPSIPSTTSMSSNSSSYKYGGKKGKKMKRSKKNKKGGFNPNMQPLLVARANEPINSLASRAAAFTGPTASASYVGGKKHTKKNRRSRY
jgi:hypothetical protein